MREVLNHLVACIGTCVREAGAEMLGSGIVVSPRDAGPRDAGCSAQVYWAENSILLVDVGIKI